MFCLLCFSSFTWWTPNFTQIAIFQITVSVAIKMIHFPASCLNSESLMHAQLIWSARIAYRATSLTKCYKFTIGSFHCQKLQMKQSWARHDIWIKITPVTPYSAIQTMAMAYNILRSKNMSGCSMATFSGWLSLSPRKRVQICGRITTLSARISLSLASYLSFSFWFMDA